MKRDNGKSTDLLVCFPTRAHLTLMPKPICSPARTSDQQKNKHHLKKFTNRTSGLKSSPVLWARTKQIGSSEITSEPTSPKVTCSGQVKIRPKTSSSSKNWQSVMEEIERIHHYQKNQKKKSTWAESIGFKKEILQFLTCLRSVRFDFRCFGSFPEASSDLTSDDGDIDDHGNNDDDDEEEEEDCNENSKTVFSKWFMVLQENKNHNKTALQKTEEEITERICVPPPNALLLMRCRSAPAKSWLEENEEAEAKTEKEDSKKLRELFLEEERIKRENELLVMRYDTDFYRLSSDIAKETWVVGGGGGGGGGGEGGGSGGSRDSFSRSLSWKR